MVNKNLSVNKINELLQEPDLFKTENLQFKKFLFNEIMYYLQRGAVKQGYMNFEGPQLYELEEIFVDFLKSVTVGESGDNDLSMGDLLRLKDTHLKLI